VESILNSVTHGNETTEFKTDVKFSR